MSPKRSILIGLIAFATTAATIAGTAFRRALDAQMAGFTGSPPPEFAAWLEKQKQTQGDDA